MKTLSIVAALGLLALPLTVASAPAFAASAHNSQAGAMGDTHNNAAPTGRHMKMKKHMKRM